MSRPLTVAVLGNPTARRGHRATASAAVVSALEDAGHRGLDIRSTSGAEAGRAAHRLVHERPGGDRPDALVVVGGDGMVHLGVGAVAGTATPLGIVPTGTGNDAARHLGIPYRDPATATRFLLGELADLRDGRRPGAVDAIRMTRPAGPRFAGLPAVGTEDAWALAVVSAGLDAAVNARANATSWPRGEARYLRAIAHEARRVRPYGYRVTTEAGTWEGPALLMAAANTSCIGGGIRIAPTASAVDGQLELLRLDPVGPLGLVPHLVRLARGRHLEHEGVTCWRSRWATIEALTPSPGRWRRPPLPMADGDPLADLPLHLEAVPGALGLLAPARPGR